MTHLTHVDAVQVVQQRDNIWPDKQTGRPPKECLSQLCAAETQSQQEREEKLLIYKHDGPDLSGDFFHWPRGGCEPVGK